jgi:putative restriction endonuclease
MKGLEYYSKVLGRLRSDRNAKWPASSLGRSPYKPLLLLSVMDLLAQGSIHSSLIEPSLDLGELFSLYCRLILPADRRYNIAMPFFHLSRDGFWHLVPLPGKEAVVASGRRLVSVGLLTQTIQGARLDEELHTLLCVRDSRDALRACLIETYFAPEVHEKLVKQGIVNQEAFDYGHFLLERARRQPVKEDELAYDAVQEPVRDQGFRHAVVIAYAHRCAMCGVRMRTPGGHTAVVAAHIIPWSISHNDDPRNGMALCTLCHWTFDEGLVSVSPDYVVITSPQLSARGNVPGHLATLQGRGVLGPSEKLLWPDPRSLKWHLQEVFLKQ